jgi:hypothetical protein
MLIWLKVAPGSATLRHSTTSRKAAGSITDEVNEFFQFTKSFRPPFCLLVKDSGYRSRGPESIPGTSRLREVVGLERGPFSQ